MTKSRRPRSGGAASEPRPVDSEVWDPVYAADRRGERCWSQYGWGAGLVPAGLEDKDPSEGGRYRARVSDRARAGAPGGRRVQ